MILARLNVFLLHGCKIFFPFYPHLSFLSFRREHYMFFLAKIRNQLPLYFHKSLQTIDRQTRCFLYSILRDEWSDSLHRLHPLPIVARVVSWVRSQNYFRRTNVSHNHPLNGGVRWASPTPSSIKEKKRIVWGIQREDQRSL